MKPCCPLSSVCLFSLFRHRNKESLFSSYQWIFLLRLKLLQQNHIQVKIWMKALLFFFFLLRKQELSTHRMSQTSRGLSAPARLHTEAPQRPAALCRVTHRCCVASGGCRAQQHTTEGAHADCWALDGNISSLWMLLLLLHLLLPLSSRCLWFPRKAAPPLSHQDKSLLVSAEKQPTWQTSPSNLTGEAAGLW